MLFLDTNEIDQLKQEADNEPTINSLEAVDAEIDRLTKIKDKLSQDKLNEEIKEIASVYTRNQYARLSVRLNAKKRFNLAQKRFNRAMLLVSEIDHKIEEWMFVKDYYNSLNKQNYASYNSGIQSSTNKESPVVSKNTEPQL